MRRLVSIIALFALVSGSAFGQLDIVKRNITATEAVNAQQVVVRDTNSIDLIKQHGGGGGSSTWGGITGDIQDQTDLQFELAGKMNQNPQSIGLQGPGSQVSNLSYDVIEMVVGAIVKMQLNPSAILGYTPYQVYSANKVTGNLFEIGQQDRLKFRVDTAGNAYANGVKLGATTAAASTSTYFLHSEASSIATYNQLLPIAQNDPETTSTAVVSSGTGEVLIKAFTTDALGLQVLPSGVWQHMTWCTVDNATGTTNIVVRFYSRTSGGIETELFSLTSGEINNTTVAEIESEIVQADLAINTTDRLVVKYYAQTTSAVNRTVTLYYEGSANYSHIHTPILADIKWGNISGTLSNQIDLWNILSRITPSTGNTFTGQFDISNHYETSYKIYTTNTALTPTVTSNPLENAVCRVLIDAGASASLVTTNIGSPRYGSATFTAGKLNELFIYVLPDGTAGALVVSHLINVIN